MESPSVSAQGQPLVEPESSKVPFNVQRFRSGSVKDILQGNSGLEEVLTSLQNDGSHLWKVRSPSKWFRRKFLMDITSLTISYESTQRFSCIPQKKPEIALSDVVDVREGWNTDMFNAIGAKEEKKRAKQANYKPQVDESTCFSIICGPQKETLDLIAPSIEVAAKWVHALRLVVQAHRSAAQEKSYEIWLRRQFNAADVDKNRSLSFSEVMKLLKALNIDMDEEKARPLFNQANVERHDEKKTDGEVLDEEEFITFYFNLLQRPELESLFSRFAPSGNFMSANELCQFLQKEQGEEFHSLTVEEAGEMINVYEQASVKTQGQMSLAGFTNMLLSNTFDIFNHKRRVVHQDMTLPLANYYIAASHNTYLIGNQLSGTSSVEGYIDAFKRGCRVVELDCWDGDGDEPIIYHGYTLTTKILFKEVLSDAVKPYAFATSQYPVILGLENHCSLPYQQKMVKHLKNILGDMLYSEDLDTDMTALPSPEQLKFKVIIRGKKKSAVSPIHSPPITGSNASSPKRQAPQPPGTKSPPKMETTDSGLDDNLPSPTDNMEGPDESNSSNSNDSKVGEEKLTKKSDLAPELSAMVSVLQGLGFQSFEESKQNGKPYHSSSFVESKAMELIADHGAEFVDFNRRHVSKVFPAGSRITSSNFNPIPFWTAGCQIVTLNYQTEDMPNFYNYVMFSENGNCGYILKPEILRNPSIKFNPTNIDSSRLVTLTIRIISGQHIPKAPGKSEVVDPYVEIKINGAIQDRSKFTTKVVHNNGFNPMWDERFQTTLRAPDLAMIFFRVYDYSQTGVDATLAHYGIPFNALMPGYRHINLVSLRGVALAPSTLFVHVGIHKS